MDEYFSRQTRRFSAAILTDCKGKRHSMAGKRLARQRSTVVNTGSELFYDRIDPENMTVEQLKPLIWRFFISLYWGLAE